MKTIVTSSDGCNMFKSLASGSLAWFPERGIGFYPVNSNVYDDSYFEKYEHYADTDRGEQITRARVELVRRHYMGPVLDVGIGSGHFIENMQDAVGYDINPRAVMWLNDRGRYQDPYTGKLFAAMTFWDSLEHLDDPRKILKAAGLWVFISMPIYEGLEHLITSKHYRKDEHFWYFTERGLITWFKDQGFVLRESSDIETRIGRQDIKSFAFRRAARDC